MFLDWLFAEVFVHTVVKLDIYLYVPNKYNKFKVLTRLFAKLQINIYTAKIRATTDATAHHE